MFSKQVIIETNEAKKHTHLEVNDSTYPNHYRISPTFIDRVTKYWSSHACIPASAILIATFE